MSYSTQEKFFRRFLYISGLVLLITISLTLIISLFTEPIDSLIDVILVAFRAAAGFVGACVSYVAIEVFIEDLKGK